MLSDCKMCHVKWEIIAICWFWRHLNDILRIWLKVWISSEQPNLKCQAPENNSLLVRMRYVVRISGKIARNHLQGSIFWHAKRAATWKLRHLAGLSIGLRNNWCMQNSLQCAIQRFVWRRKNIVTPLSFLILDNIFRVPNFEKHEHFNFGFGTSKHKAKDPNNPQVVFSHPLRPTIILYAIRLPYLSVQGKATKLSHWFQQ